MDCATKRIEELEDASVLEVLEAGTEMLSRGHEKYHIITDEQIRAVWIAARGSESSLSILRLLGIERDGDGWKIGGDDE